MAKAELPAPDDLRKALEYTPETGRLMWKERDASFFSPNDKYGPHWRAKIWNSRNAGKPALNNLGARGYLCGTFGGRVLTAHRVAWAIFYGAWPKGEIDHIDGRKTNNAINNLRDCTTQQNAQNRRARIDQHPGLQWRPDMGKWSACITVNFKTIYLGAFVTEAEAVEARRAAEALHGFHPNHGRRPSHDKPPARSPRSNI